MCIIDGYTEIWDIPRDTNGIQMAGRVESMIAKTPGRRSEQPWMFLAGKT